jgi:hypothetical protein
LSQKVFFLIGKSRNFLSRIKSKHGNFETYTRGFHRHTPLTKTFGFSLDEKFFAIFFMAYITGMAKILKSLHHFHHFRHGESGENSVNSKIHI